LSKTNCIILPGAEPIPILFEDRSVLAIDKPRGWMLVPFSWQKTNRNLQAAIVSSIAAGDFWARSRGLKFLRFVHRLDAETTGVMLFAKSPGAVESYSALFESRRMEKTYLAVVAGEPGKDEWKCRLKLGPDTRQVGRQRVDAQNGKEAETHFRVLATSSRSTQAADSIKQTASKVGRLSPATTALVECRPLTGRTHQIRIHLAESGCPIVGDELYGKSAGGRPLGLRAIRLAYVDPFTRRGVEIRAPASGFCHEFGFDLKEEKLCEQRR